MSRSPRARLFARDTRLGAVQCRSVRRQCNFVTIFAPGSSPSGDTGVSCSLSFSASRPAPAIRTRRPPGATATRKQRSRAGCRDVRERSLFIDTAKKAPRLGNHLAGYTSVSSTFQRHFARRRIEAGCSTVRIHEMGRPHAGSLFGFHNARRHTVRHNVPSIGSPVDDDESCAT